MRVTVTDAFRSPEWSEALEAWYAALGISVLVVDPAEDLVLSAGPRTGLCDAVPLDSECCPYNCAPDRPGERCRAGMPFRVLPLVLDGRQAARIVLCGYTTSASERASLAAAMTAHGLSRDEARAIVRGTPVIPKRRMAAVERMVLHQAEALVRRALAERRPADHEQLRSIGEVLQASSASPDDRREAARWLLEAAVRAVDGVGGSIALAEGDSSEVSVLLETGISHAAAHSVLIRTLASGRSSVAGHLGGGSRHASICVPVKADDRHLGVVCITVSAQETSEAVRKAEEFVSVAAHVVDAVLSRQSRDREVYELVQVSEVARELHQSVEVNDIAPLAAGLLAKTLDAPLSGVAFTAYGSERAAVAVEATVWRQEILEVLAEATGHPSAADLETELVVHLGEVVDDTAPAREWTVLSETLSVGEKVVGYLFAARLVPNRFDAADNRLLRRLAAHVAVAFERSALFARLRNEYAGTVELLSAALDAGEGMKPGHAGKVMEYAMRIGEELELPAEDLELLRFAGLVHDIGKIGVSEELLLKPARLSEEEADQVRRHAEIGATLLEQVGFVNAVAPIVLHHHERWDGLGYPAGLSGEDIPLLSRILTVADAFASMTADTPHRKALSVKQAQAEVQAGSGSTYDPRVVEALVATLQRMEMAGLSGLLERFDSTSRFLPM